jgi:hypothetical protein
MQLPFTWDDLDAHVSSLHASISIRFLQLQALQAPRPAVSVPAPSATYGDEFIEEDEEMVRNDEDASPVPVDEVEKDWEDKKVRLAPLRGEYQAGRSRTRDQELAVPMPVHAPDAGNPIFQQPYAAYQLQPELPMPRTNLPMLQQQLYVPYRQENLAVAMQTPNSNYGVPMVPQPYLAYGRPEFISQAPMVNEHVLQQLAHHQPYYPVVPSNNSCYPMLRHQEHVTAESGIRKDTNHVMMVNKTTKFKCKGKSKKKVKSKDAGETDTPRKSKIGHTPDEECFFCKEKGHWKRNCKKYLVEKGSLKSPAPI